MSDVTNLFLAFSISEDEISRVEEVNWFQHRGSDLALTSVDFSIGGVKWYAGSKSISSPVYFGVFNHFDLDSFVQYIADLNWKEPDRVQLIVKGEEDELFRIINLTDTEV